MKTETGVPYRKIGIFNYSSPDAADSTGQYFSSIIIEEEGRRYGNYT